MKKILLVVLAGLIMLPFAAQALEGTATVSAKDLYSLASRKTYRLGLRGTIISPTKDILINKDATYDLGLEFDAKLNENLDMGPRFGFGSFKSKTLAYDATYNILRFGFGGRIYMLYWGETASTHGLFNTYINLEADYYNASKSTENIVNSPASFAGMGGMVGAGVEIAFGPNTGGFVEADIQRTSIKNADGSQELPLDGYILAAGARLAFF